MRANEELTREEFIDQKNLLISEQARMKSLINDNESSSANWLELAEKFLDMSFQARDIISGNDLESKRKLIITVGENLLLKDRKLVFTFRKPFDVLLKPAYRQSVLPDV